MFFNWGKPSARRAARADRDTLLALTRYEQRVHVHLDWRPVEDWLGEQPFWLAEKNRAAVGALACPPDRPDTAWLRLFALANGASAEAIWQLLWPRALEQLQTLKVQSAAALSVEAWTEPLFRSSGFERTHAVVVLECANTAAIAGAPSPPARLRPATAADHPAIIAADTAAFEPPWQLSAEMLRLAIAQADYLTVAEAEGNLIGYQLTTASAHGGAHLGRLAVLPGWQGRGLGAALTADVLAHYQQRGTPRVTVNTQDSNRASLRVYQRLGFELTGETFPVHQLML